MILTCVVSTLSANLVMYLLLSHLIYCCIVGVSQCKAMTSRKELEESPQKTKFQHMYQRNRECLEHRRWEDSGEEITLHNHKGLGFWNTKCQQVRKMRYQEMLIDLTLSFKIYNSLYIEVATVLCSKQDIVVMSHVNGKYLSMFD